MKSARVASRVEDLHPVAQAPACRRPLFDQFDAHHFQVGGDQGQRGEGGRADGEALAGGRGGVAQRIQGVGALAHLGAQAAHLGIAAGVVGDGAVGVAGQGDAEGGEHAHRRDRHPVEARR